MATLFMLNVKFFFMLRESELKAEIFFINIFCDLQGHVIELFNCKIYLKQKRFGHLRDYYKPKINSSAVFTKRYNKYT